jgi:signal transduction histidine kinase
MRGRYKEVAMYLKDLSIKRKLSLITLWTSSLALVLSSVSFLIYDLITFRHLLSQDLVTQAEIIGNNSAAPMAFKDKVAATATVWALKAKEDVVLAVLYTTDGNIFASYVRTDTNIPAPLPPHPPRTRGFHFTGGYFEVSRDVTLNGNDVGVLFLQSDMRQWDARVRRYVSILLIFVLASGFFAWLVSSKLQVLIAGPILHLASTMKMVSTNKSYQIRATKLYNDEIGSLIDDFNTMLSEIQQRDSALQSANVELKTSTLELEKEIIEHKRTQEELLRAKQAAEEASRTKSAFLANMSHELRTPLNAIIGYSEMLEDESQELEHAEFAKDLQKIQSAGKHLLALINDVLDLSKIEAGKMTLQLENFDLSVLIIEMMSTFQLTAEKNANKLRVRLSEDAGTMRADITKVRQILFNLMSNACKFTDHGTISLEVDRITADSQECIRFRVVDTGIGITPEQQSRLFQEFVQADGSISRKYGGSGLGLVLCDRFVKMMEGDINVDSQFGHGSTFTVRLPAEVRLVLADATKTEAPSDDPIVASATRSGRTPFW